MATVDRIRADKLQGLARERFASELLEAEAGILVHSTQFGDPIERPGRGPANRATSAEVRPEFLRWLVTDADAAALIEHRGIRVWEAVIPRSLDLRGCRVSSRLEFRYCNFKEEMNLISAEILSLYIMHSKLDHGISGSRIKLHGPLFFREVDSIGLLNFENADIEGEALFSRTLLNEDTSSDPRKRVVLDLSGANIRHGLQLGTKFESHGEVRMTGGFIGGTLSCDGAKFHASGYGLTIDDITVGNDVLLTSEFESAGTVRLRNVEIGGDLVCSGAKLAAPDTSLSFARSSIGGSVYLDKGFEAEGTVIGSRAELDRLDCRGAKLRGDEISLTVEMATIRELVLLNDGFEAKGKVSFFRTSVGGFISCVEAAMGSFDGTEMRLDGRLLWKRIPNSKSTALNLSDATIGSLVDDQQSWPGQDGLSVCGLVYRGLTKVEPKRTRVPERIAWLNLQDKEHRADPQPWMQLAKLLADSGLKKDAKRVVFELRRNQAETQWEHNILRRWWALSFAWLEEQPARILFPILLCVGLGTAVFWTFRTHFAETNQAAYIATHRPPDESHYPAPAYPQFQPAMYALENALPIVKLGQDDKWAPDSRSGMREYRILMGTRWFLVIAGWIQGLVLVAAVSGRFRD